MIWTHLLEIHVGMLLHQSDCSSSHRWPVCSRFVTVTHNVEFRSTISTDCHMPIGPSFPSESIHTLIWTGLKGAHRKIGLTKGYILHDSIVCVLHSSSCHNLGNTVCITPHIQMWKLNLQRLVTQWEKVMDPCLCASTFLEPSWRETSLCYCQQWMMRLPVSHPV